MSGLDNVKQLDPASVELGGRVRRLQYDMNAFAELEKRYGSIEEAMSAMESGSMKDLKIVVWAGLIHDEVAEIDEDSGEPLKYNITPYSVGAMITSPTMLPKITTALSKAIGGALPQADVDAALRASEEAAKNFTVQ